jgi:hypothetical protein
MPRANSASKLRRDKREGRYWKDKKKEDLQTTGKVKA